jgi:broad specificity phosphatase PhoE
VYVVRHGLTDMNKRGIVNAEIDEPLVAEGIKQAKDATQKAPKGIRYIYTSPLKRTTQTAEVFATFLSLPVETSADLTEVKMGTLAGKAWDEMPSGETLKKEHRTVRFDYTTYGGESLEEVINRLRAFMIRIEDNHKDGEVLVVTHGGVIRVLNFLESKQRVYETEKNANILVFDTTKILAP